MHTNTEPFSVFKPKEKTCSNCSSSNNCKFKQEKTQLTSNITELKKSITSDFLSIEAKVNCEIFKSK